MALRGCLRINLMLKWDFLHDTKKKPNIDIDSTARPPQVLVNNTRLNASSLAFMDIE